MKAEIIAFTAIEGIEIPVITGRGERFLDHYYLTNDRSIIQSIIEDTHGFIGSV